MSDAIFKASLTQTLAYIDAYNVELLRAIEKDFKTALQCPDGGDVRGRENEVAQRSTPCEESLTLLKELPPAPRSKRPSLEYPQPKAQAYQVELTKLPNWHFQLPFYAAAVATILLLFTR